VGKSPKKKGMGDSRKKESVAEQVQSLEDTAQQTVRFVAASIVQLCRDNRLKPGWAVLGCCEFIALMVHQNMPPERYPDELKRFSEYIETRLGEFNVQPATPDPQ
jgi:hypothetical protein